MTDICNPGNAPVKLGPGSYAKVSESPEDGQAVKELREVADPVGQALVDMRSAASSRRSKAIPVTKPSIEPSAAEKWIVGPFEPNTGQRSVVGPGGKTASVDVLSNGPSEPGSKAQVILDASGQPLGVLPQPKGPDLPEEEEEEPVTESLAGGVKVFYVTFRRFRDGVSYRPNAFFNYLPKFDSFEVSVWVGGDRPEIEKIWSYEVPANRADDYPLPEAIQADSSGSGLDDWIVYCYFETQYKLPGQELNHVKQNIQVRVGPESKGPCVNWDYEHIADPFDTGVQQGLIGKFLEFAYKGQGLIEIYSYLTWLGTFDPDSVTFTSILGHTIQLNQGFSFYNVGSYSFSEPMGKLGTIYNGIIEETNIGTATANSSVSFDGLGGGTYTSNLSGSTLTITSAEFEGDSDDWYRGPSASDYVDAKRPILPNVYVSEKSTGGYAGELGGNYNQDIEHIRWSAIIISPDLTQCIAKKQTLINSFNGTGIIGENQDTLKTEWYLYDKPTNSFLLLQTVEAKQHSNLNGGVSAGTGETDYVIYSQIVSKSLPIAMYQQGSDQYWVTPEEGDINRKFSDLLSRFYDDNSGYFISEGNKYIDVEGTMHGNLDYYHPNSYLATLHQGKLYFVNRPAETTWEDVYNNGGTIPVEVYSLPLNTTLEPDEVIEVRLEPILLGGLQWYDLYYRQDNEFLSYFLGHRYAPT